MNRNLLSNATTVVMVVCALVVTAAVVKREFLPRARAAAPALEPRAVEGFNQLAGTGQLMGRADAPVRIVEFSDFQCPFCASFQRTLNAVRERHPDRLAVVYRHFPLDRIHPHARTAALASECAGEQKAFESYANLLFAQQDSIGLKAWERFAREAGVGDADAFTGCMSARRRAPAVELDTRAGSGIRVEVTPSIVINGVLIPGVVSEAELEKWVLDPSSIPKSR